MRSASSAERSRLSADGAGVANAAPGGSGGNVRTSAIEGLIILGQPVTAAPNATRSARRLGDGGAPRVRPRPECAEREDLGEDDGGRPRHPADAGPRRVAGREPDPGRVRRSDCQGGSAPRRLLRLRLLLRRDRPKPPPPPPPPAQPSAEQLGEDADARSGAASRRRSAHARSSPSPKHQPILLTAGPYIFPVFGQVSYSDSFGAFRADTGWHHGDDIFAQLGTPVLAVAKGVVFSVGWNTLGGNRLWLADRQGNQFYYAHLSSYSPLAVNGARVNAGDVLGFVGNTGDAITTPYHLHFEIHPVSLLGKGYDGVVDPTPYLTSWEHLRNLSFSGGVAPHRRLDRQAEEPRARAGRRSARRRGHLHGRRPRSRRRQAGAGSRQGSRRRARARPRCSAYTKAASEDEEDEEELEPAEAPGPLPWYENSGSAPKTLSFSHLRVAGPRTD